MLTGTNLCPTLALPGARARYWPKSTQLAVAQTDRAHAIRFHNFSAIGPNSRLPADQPSYGIASTACLSDYDTAEAGSITPISYDAPT